MKRPIHTMTYNEFNEWSKNVLGELGKDEADKHIANISKSLYDFCLFIATYGNLDSFSWLIENGFDLSFKEAKKNGRNLL